MLARLAGIKTGIITKRISETVALRARDLKIDHVYQGIQDKASVFAQILEKDGITAAEAAFVGDDVIDLPAMRKCGLAIAVKNARPEVKAEAHWATLARRRRRRGPRRGRVHPESTGQMEAGGGGIYFGEKLRRSSYAIRRSRFAKPFAWRIARSECETRTAKSLKFTHRLLAWGVLGLATGGCLFSLLTLLFSGA